MTYTPESQRGKSMKNHIENRLRRVDKLIHNNDYYIYEALLEIRGLFADMRQGEYINPFCLDNLRSDIKGINGVHNILQILDKEQEHGV